MRMLRAHVALLAAALFAMPNAAAAPPDPHETLARAAGAMSALPGVRYDAIVDRLDEDGQPAGAIEAEVVLVRAPGQSMFFNERFVVRGVYTAPGEDPQRFTLSFDGERLRRIDHDRRRVTFCDDPQPIEFMRLLGDLRFAIERQYVLERPLGLALTPSVERVSEGPIDFHGVQCVRVETVSRVRGPEGRPVENRTAYWIGADDHLLHGVESSLARTRLEGLAVLNAEEAAEIDFRLEPPAGFGVTRYSEESQPAQAPQLLATGQRAPVWSLSTFGGDQISLADLRGDVVVLDFSASWCIPCIRFMPALQGIHDDLAADGVHVVCVNTPEPVVGASLEPLWKREGFSFPLLDDADGAVRDAYRVTALPTLYIIDQQGRIAFSHVGAGPGAEAEIRRTIRALLDDERTN